MAQEWRRVVVDDSKLNQAVDDDFNKFNSFILSQFCTAKSTHLCINLVVIGYHFLHSWIGSHGACPYNPARAVI